MTRCRVEQDELDHDMQQGQWAPVKSLFEFADDVEELGPEEHRPTGYYKRVGGIDIFIPTGSKK